MLRFRSHFSLFARSTSRCLKDLNSDVAFHNFSRPYDTPEYSIGDRFTLLDTKLKVGFDFATTSSSPGFLSCIDLFGMVREFLIGTAARKQCKIHAGKHPENMIPFITGEIAFPRHVCEFVFS